MPRGNVVKSFGNEWVGEVGVVDAHLSINLRCQPRDLLAFVHTCCQGLLDKHMAAQSERLEGERRMRRGRRGHVNNFDPKIPQRVNLPNHMRNRVLPCKCARTLRVHIADRHQFHVGARSDACDVKRRNMAGPNNCSSKFNRCVRHCSRKWPAGLLSLNN